MAVIPYIPTGDRRINQIQGLVNQAIKKLSQTSASFQVRKVKGSYTVLSTDEILLVDASAGPLVLYLPRSSSVTGQIFRIKKIDSSLNACQIAFNGQGDTLDGLSTYNLFTENEALTIFSTGLGYEIESHWAETDWASWSPVSGFSWNGLGTPTKVTLAWRRRGQFIDIQGALTAGTTSANPGQLPFPSFATPDSARLYGSPATRIGFVSVYATFGGSLSVEFNSSSPNYFLIGAQGNLTSNSGWIGASNPIGNWVSSSTQLSLDYSYPVVNWMP